MLTHSSWNSFQVNILIVITLVEIELVAGTAPNNPIVRLCTMPSPTICFYLGFLFTGSAILTQMHKKIPFNMSSRQRQALASCSARVRRRRWGYRGSRRSRLSKVGDEKIRSQSSFQTDDIGVELELGHWILNSSHSFNGAGYGVERKYWLRRRLGSAVGWVGGVFCFYVALRQGLPEKGED